MQNLLFHKIDHYRPTYQRDATRVLGVDYGDPLYSSVRCCVQPATGKDTFFYLQQNIIISHTVYFNKSYGWQLDDLLQYGDRAFVITGVRNLIELNRCWAVDCYEYMGVQKQVV